MEDEALLLDRNGMVLLERNSAPVWRTDLLLTKDWALWMWRAEDHFFVAMVSERPFLVKAQTDGFRTHSFSCLEQFEIRGKKARGREGEKSEIAR
jgi:hypothetical protein